MKKRHIILLILLISTGCIYVLWIQFSKQASGPMTRQNTTIEFNRDSVGWGNFRYVDTKNATFEIKNTGDFPLIIKNIETSCGCTEAEWNKKPILPGRTGNIQITFKPNSLGYFSKTIQVFCNIPSQKYALNINGFVEE